MKKLFLSFFLALTLITFSAPDAAAEAWWGKGARSENWILARGGTVIHYKIVANGAKDRYKAILYKNGKVVEWENGKKGIFNDPKNGTYVVKAFRGGIVKNDKTSKGGKKIMSTGKLVAHPGEEIYVTLNDLTNKVSITSVMHTVKHPGYVPKKKK